MNDYSPPPVPTQKAELSYAEALAEMRKHGLLSRDWPAGCSASWLREGVYSAAMLLQWMVD